MKKSEAKKAAEAKSTKNPAPAKASIGDVLTARIKLLVKDNPKRGASARRFALYRNGQSVDDALKAGVKRADIRWDQEHKFITVN